MSELMWAPAIYQSSRTGEPEPCAVQLPITPLADAGAFFIVDAGGTVLGGIVGTVTLLATEPYHGWVAAVANAKSWLDREDAA